MFRESVSFFIAVAAVATVIIAGSCAIALILASFGITID